MHSIEPLEPNASMPAHAAIEKINDLNPEILDTNPRLYFQLQLQRLIELVASEREAKL